VGAGINGKMNELCAVAGLVQLKYIEKIIESRKKIDAIYRNGLRKITGIRLNDIDKNVKSNYSYFPILVENNYRLSRDGLKEFLEAENIYTRRYFYPIITDFELYKEQINPEQCELKNAKEAASKILCLPIYPDLSTSEIKKIINVIHKGSLNNG
jgi:dTDP-4-amino-4,6-dideoxygalactose transaminase